MFAIMRLIYNGILCLVLPLALLRLYWRGRRDPGHRQRWRERLGWIPPLPEPGCLWVHAVSVGETRAALPLVRTLRERYPDMPLLVTTTTLTGSRQVREALGAAVHHVYAPYDLPGATARFLRAARPRIAVIMETELWPNLLRHCAAAGIPVVIANARLSERSARGYARIRRLTAAMLRDVTLIAAQAEADAERFRALGAPRVEVVGNLKYDLQLPEDLPEQGLRLRERLGVRRPVWIAASTHAGEDEVILDTFALLRPRWPELLLLLVPRHPERFDGVVALCQQRGLPVIRRSAEQPCPPETAVLVGDSMGELLQFYAAADLAFVGGSLVATGGHNVLEPALLGLPVLFGPHMFNFTEAGQRLLEAEAAWQVTDAATLATAVDRLLADPERRRAAGERGRAVVERHRGALVALLASVAALLATPCRLGRRG
jgi:3-deoxy-D-manno-octulosonic-acid transferase